MQKGQGAHKTLGGNVAMACSNSQNNAFAEYYGFPNLCITLKIISLNLEGKIEVNKKLLNPNSHLFSCTIQFHEIKGLLYAVVGPRRHLSVLKSTTLLGSFL